MGRHLWCCRVCPLNSRRAGRALYPALLSLVVPSLRLCRCAAVGRRSLVRGGDSGDRLLLLSGAGSADLIRKVQEHHQRCRAVTPQSPTERRQHASDGDKDTGEEVSSRRRGARSASCRMVLRRTSSPTRSEASCPRARGARRSCGGAVWTWRRRTAVTRRGEHRRDEQWSAVHNERERRRAISMGLHVVACRESSSQRWLTERASLLAIIVSREEERKREKMCVHGRTRGCDSRLGYVTVEGR